jgi:hypothetical protein
VLDAVEWLVAHDGAEVTWLPVDALGGSAPTPCGTPSTTTSRWSR